MKHLDKIECAGESLPPNMLHSVEVGQEMLRQETTCISNHTLPRHLYHPLPHSFPALSFILSFIGCEPQITHYSNLSW